MLRFSLTLQIYSGGKHGLRKNQGGITPSFESLRTEDRVIASSLHAKGGKASASG